MQRLSNDCNALFGPIKTSCGSIALMELKPPVKEFFLVWDFGDTRL